VRGPGSAGFATAQGRIYRDGALILLGSTHVDSSSDAAPGGTCGTTSERESTGGRLKTLYR